MSNEEGGAPTALTIEAVTELVTKTVNAAITGREKRFTEAIGKTLEDRFAKFAEALPKPPDPNAEPDSKAKVDPELVKLRQETASLAKKLEATEKARVEAESRSRREKATNMLTAAYAKHATPEAVAMLVKASLGDVTFDDAGEPMLPLLDGTGSSSIDAVVNDWAKSEGAKAFRPAPTGGGSGQRNAKTAPVAIPPGAKIGDLSDAQRESLLRTQTT